ncbi:MAG: hypothetical protein RQ966_12920 [Acetobacteraceae bacterium]|nr:hypothetical protein [Acetobacteraceae bacterium]
MHPLFPADAPGNAGERPRRGWHHGSLYGPGPRRPLSAGARRAWLARAELERRAGALTALHVEVGRALLRRLGADGRCDPAHVTLAADAGCGERTVRRALAALRALGMLTWEQRIERRAWPEGGQGASRAEQVSNAYALVLPTAPVSPLLCAAVRALRGARPRANTGGQPGRGTPGKYVSTPPPAFDPAAKAALQEIAAARTVQLRSEWAARQAARWGRSTP